VLVFVKSKTVFGDRQMENIFQRQLLYFSSSQDTSVSGAQDYHRNVNPHQAFPKSIVELFLSQWRNRQFIAQMTKREASDAIADPSWGWPGRFSIRFSCYRQLLPSMQVRLT
jgi:hypothetical protein